MLIQWNQKSLQECADSFDFVKGRWVDWLCLLPSWDLSFLLVECMAPRLST